MREGRVSIKNFLFIKLKTNRAKSLPEACHPRVSNSKTDNFQKFQPTPSSEEKGPKLKANKTSEPSPQHQHKINLSNIPIRLYLNPYKKLLS
jgi:hypothetical protein